VKKIDTVLVTDMMSYMTALSLFEAGSESDVIIERGGDEIQMSVIWD
jgi:hypothetical protein